MPIVNVYEAKTQLSKLIDLAASGQDVVIARNGKPVARLTTVDAPIASLDRLELLKARGFGALEGKGWIADDFDEPLPPEVLAEFEGM
jgi:prevent-host-death family protein